MFKSKKIHHSVTPLPKDQENLNDQTILTENNVTSMGMLRDQQQSQIMTISDMGGNEEWRQQQDQVELYHMDKHLVIDEVNKSQLNEIARYKGSDSKGNKKTLYIKEVQKKNDLILNISEKSSIDKLIAYEDGWPCLNCRKSVWKIRIYVNEAAFAIINHTVFENSVITVILLNSMTLAAEKPEDEPAPEIILIDYIFLGLYSLEMVLKIIGMGFIFNKGAYLRDFWGILDFIIVSSAYFELYKVIEAKAAEEAAFLAGEEINQGGDAGALNALRAFRVLRPLRAITSIQGLRVIVVSIMEALPMLQQTVSILFGFFLIFAIGGVQLMSGYLKQRCVNIENGRIHPEEILCGGMESCPEGYFCGKMNENPNNGSTNLDNIFYAILMVFQCTTLEGWSDIQTLYQKTYANIIFVYFLSIVFLGAFFLINLTLAVINASFTKSQKNINQNQDQDQDQGGEEMAENDDNEIMLKDEKQFGITQFFIAKRAAKKMIEFLRMKQLEKKMQLERNKEFALKMAKRTPAKAFDISGQRQFVDSFDTPNEDRRNSKINSGQSPLQSPSLTPKSQVKIKNELLKTELSLEGQFSLNQQTANKFNDSIQFQQKSETDLDDEAIFDNHNADVQKFLDDINDKEGSYPDQERVFDVSRSQIGSMAGLNEGVRSRGLLRGIGTAEHGARRQVGQLFKNTREPSPDHRNSIDNMSLISDPSQLVFDKIVPAEHSQAVQGHTDRVNPRYHQSQDGDHPFDLSFNESIDHDLDGDRKVTINQSLDEINSIIDSDLSLHDQLKTYKQQKEAADQEAEDERKKPTNITVQQKQLIMSMKKKIRRYETSIFDNRDPLARDSVENTTIDGLQKDQSNISLYDPRVNKQIISVEAKNDQDPNFSQLVKQETNNKDKKLKQEHAERKKFAMNNVDEAFLQMKKPKDPYDFINKRTQNIRINPGVIYKSTSEHEVFENRRHKINQSKITNEFIQLPAPETAEEMDFRLDYGGYQMSKNDPYKLKTCYKIIGKEEESEHTSDEEDDDIFQDQPQPYKTVTSLGYKTLLTQLDTQIQCRRSDILVSSTLSFTLSQMEAEFHKKNLAEMNPKQLKEWLDLRSEFRAKSISQHQIPQPGYMPAYYTNPIRETFKNQLPTQFQSSVTPDLVLINELTESPKQDERQKKVIQRILTRQKQEKLKQTMMKINAQNMKLLPNCLLRVELDPEEQQRLQEDERKIYNQQKAKYEGVKRAYAKQNKAPEDIEISLADARKMRFGNYHEENNDDAKLDGEDDDKLTKENSKATTYLTRSDNFINGDVIDQFEKSEAERLADALRNPSIKNLGDEIPDCLRVELDLPKNMLNKNGVMQLIDYTEVRFKDCQIKRKTPIWSGQDVLEDNLTNDQCLWITSFLNDVRVWPYGFFGFVKKQQCFLKVITKSSFFDNLMLGSVLLNTFLMALDRYGLSEETKASYEFYNLIFTWIFIIEMGIKLLAIGVKKYVQEPLNILDGSVVLLSLVELIMGAVNGTTGGGSVTAFRAIRIFRTLRVLRVARLLRALESMQVIISVLTRSASSFAYIASLLFLFIFIFALLGKTIFGGKFNFDNGKPRGNFDTFAAAFVTVFQVLTMENWQFVLYDSMRSDVGKVAPCIFYIVWIFLGNFVLLNLFLAILLDSFLVEDEQDGEGQLDSDVQLQKQIKKALRKEAAEREKLRKLKRLSMSMSMNANFALMHEQATQKPKKAVKKGMAGLTAMNNIGEDMLEVDQIEDLDANTVREMFLDAGVLKDKTNQRKKDKQFQGVYCERSCYLFEKKSGFRKVVYNIQVSSIFDNIIMTLIVLSSVKLAVDTYFKEEGANPTVLFYSDILDYVFNICFLIECILKIIALGFLMDTGSYLRDGWNQLDFFIVVSAILDMILTNITDISVFKILRLLRTLRPLRMISHNLAMRMIVSALFESVGAIFNVLIVVASCWLVFAILAISFFSGKSFYCSINKYHLRKKYDCNVAGGSWRVYDSNYDNVMNAMMTLFIVSTLEGWPDIMYSSWDATQIDEGPIFENSPAYTWFYIVFIMVGSFFLLNFFIGVLFLKYTQAQREETKGYTKKHLNWMAIQKMVTDANVEHSMANQPNENWRFSVWKIVNSKKFEYTIMVMIVLNMIQLACNYEDSPAYWEMMLRISNYIFTAVFLVEAILNIMTYGWSYFQTSWNKFDFFVVAASLVDLGLEFIGTEALEGLPIGNIAKILRVLRVSRVLRLATKSKDLQALIQTISMSMGALMNVFALLVIILFMFAVLGVFLFSELSDGDVIDARYKNFKTFGTAFLLLFAIATGEDWNKLMYDCMDTKPECEEGKTCGWKFSAIYYIIFILIITHVMLNLFILVIIQQFETYYVNEDNPIAAFSKDFDLFHAVWVVETERWKCIKIKEKLLLSLFKKLDYPLGFKTIENSFPQDSDMKKTILKMGIRSEDGWIYFNELLYRCLRKVHGNFKLNKRMQYVELLTQFKISMITINMKVDKNKADNEMIFNALTTKGQSVNPFLTQMYFRISFTTWLNAARKNRDRMLASGEDNISKAKAQVVERDDFIQVPVESYEIFEVTSDEDDHTPEKGSLEAAEGFASPRKSKGKIKRQQSIASPSKGILRQHTDQQSSAKKRKSRDGKKRQSKGPVE